MSLYLQKSAGQIPTDGAEIGQKAPGFLHTAGKLVLGAGVTMLGGAGVKFMGGKALGAVGASAMGKVKNFMENPATQNKLSTFGKNVASNVRSSGWFDDAKKLYNKFTSPATDIVNKAKIKSAIPMSGAPRGVFNRAPEVPNIPKPSVAIKQTAPAVKTRYAAYASAAGPRVKTTPRTTN
jgi:hypothetical protein